ncbi:MAG: hypothetical protein HY720_03475 [Planctomycetes bacterium]|nr:hypothetical protein [Planctomycetota bacterium]
MPCRLAPILARCGEPENAYATDEDTGGPDPLAPLRLREGPDRVPAGARALARFHREHILDRYVRDGESWVKAREGYELSLELETRAISMMANWREIPSDGRFRIRLNLLAETIRADRAAGRRPFLVVGNAGTTNTGAVDDLPSLAELAAREGLWFHADAAYGGFFLLTGRGRRALAGIERADSVVLDPHKGLFLPYGTGALLVRDGEVLRRAHAVRADYLPAMAPDEEKVDFCQISPERLLKKGPR